MSLSHLNITFLRSMKVLPCTLPAAIRTGDIPVSVQALLRAIMEQTTTFSGLPVTTEKCNNFMKPSSPKSRTSVSVLPKVKIRCYRAAPQTSRTLAMMNPHYPHLTRSLRHSTSLTISCQTRLRTISTNEPCHPNTHRMAYDNGYEFGVEVYAQGEATTRWHHRLLACRIAPTRSHRILATNLNPFAILMIRANVPSRRSIKLNCPLSRFPKAIPSHYLIIYPRYPDHQST